MTDANTLIAGTAWPRFPYEVLQHAVNGDYRLVLSQEIINETRYALARIVPSAINIGAFEEFLATTPYELAAAPSTAEIARHLDLVRDPNDIHVALAALNAGVDCLITQDKDFIAQDESTQKIRERLNILTPGAFLRYHMGWTSEALETIRGRSWTDF